MSFIVWGDNLWTQKVKSEFLQFVPEAVRRVWTNDPIQGTGLDVASLASIIVTMLRVEL